MKERGEPAVKNSVIIKHVQHGLRIRLDGREEWDELLAEVRNKFASSANFFGNASLTLTFDGRKLTEKEEDEIIDIIEDVTDIQILCVFVEDPGRGNLYLRVGEAAAEYYLRQKAHNKEGAGEAVPDRNADHPDADGDAGEDSDPRVSQRYQILTHSLHAGDICRTDKTVIVLGNVEDGAALTTARDAIILGSARGAIRAGEGAGTLIGRSYFVAASDLRPKKLSIGGTVQRSKSRKFSRAFPAVAAVKDGAVVMVPFDGDVEALLRPDIGSLQDDDANEQGTGGS